MITGASLVMTSSVANLTLGETGDCKPGLKCSLAGWGSEEVVMNLFYYLGQDTLQRAH